MGVYPWNRTQAPCHSLPARKTETVIGSTPTNTHLRDIKVRCIVARRIPISSTELFGRSLLTIYTRLCSYWSAILSINGFTLWCLDDNPNMVFETTQSSVSILDLDIALTNGVGTFFLFENMKIKGSSYEALCLSSNQIGQSSLCLVKTEETLQGLRIMNFKGDHKSYWEVMISSDAYDARRNSSLSSPRSDEVQRQLGKIRRIPILREPEK
ncbi:hypothetical protein VNO77_04330 [Canavalia gladiata]|uniref:Uncharacterized protein n=1 Tax=Canavalia gladiata TaxID=3824 RepID=A0AAN9R7N9_CANGL